MRLPETLSRASAQLGPPRAVWHRQGPRPHPLAVGQRVACAVPGKAVAPSSAELNWLAAGYCTGGYCTSGYSAGCHRAARPAPAAPMLVIAHSAASCGEVPTVW